MPADIIAIFERHGIKTTKKTSNEWSSPCPACDGEDRCSIWPDDQEGRGYYWCRRCECQGDSIQFLRDFCNMSYAEACKEVGVAVAISCTPPRIAPGANRHKKLAVAEKRDSKHIDTLQGRELWLTKAQAFTTWAHNNLLNNPTELAWLAKRGLSLNAVKQYGLGWNTGEKGYNSIIRSRESWGLMPEIKKDGKPKRLWIPRGLVIPQLGKKDEATIVHRLRIRRTEKDREQFNPKQKYTVVPGSEMEMLFLPCSNPESPSIVVVVESELDGLLLNFIAGDFVSVLACMTSTVTNISKEVFATLEQASCILVALDFDEEDKKGKRAGTEGCPRWMDTFARAKRWPVPAGKDPGEAFEQGEDLRLWLQAGLPEGLRFAMTARQSPDMGKREGVPALQEKVTAGQEREEDEAIVHHEERAVEQEPKKAEVEQEPKKAEAEELQKNREVGQQQKAPYQEKCLRWQRGIKPLEQVTLPENCYWGINGLRLEYTGKEVNDDLLIICPKTNFSAFQMVHKKKCATCKGHENCLLDFILSKEIMLQEDEFCLMY